MKPLFWNCEVGKISGKERTMKRLQIKAERSKKEVPKLSPGDILERGRVHSRNLDHFTRDSAESVASHSSLPIDDLSESWQ
jgi:hypothetical protein